MLLTGNRGQFAEHLTEGGGIHAIAPRSGLPIMKLVCMPHVQNGGGKWTFAKKGDRSARKARAMLVVSLCRDSRGQWGVFATMQSSSQRKGFPLRLHA